MAHDSPARPTKNYFCSEPGCGMRFDKPSRLLWHSRTHSGERPHKCENSGCDKSYPTTTKLKRHQKKCMGSVVKPVEPDQEELKYKCQVQGCTSAFKRRMNLYNHNILVHEKPAKFKCGHPDCDKAFAFPTLLKRHMKTHQGYKCKECEEIFEKWSALREHMSLNHRVVHKCDQCTKTFKRPCDLRRHTLTHEGKKEVYPCPEEGCDRFYDRVTTLRKHIKSQHHGELPFSCDHCEATFPRKADAEKHKRFHTKSTESKKYPNKGHRKISQIERLIGPPGKLIETSEITTQEITEENSPHDKNSESIAHTQLMEVDLSNNDMVSR